MDIPFSGWREGLPHYLPWFAVALVVTVGLRYLGHGWVAVPFWVVAFAALLFFRDFPRQGAAGPDELFSPADGTVVAIETLEETPHYDGAAMRISIFMSVFNVHVNRAPFDGVVREVRYAPGAYKDARDPEASRVNESSALWLETERGPVSVRQISGAVARRIVCRARPGMGLKRGEKFGMIKFGSRVELYLPPGSQACVPVGAKTKAGLTILARFP
ncbi:MAG: phosphatidylserine decarboxylase family protein [Candidatus Hydrogenedentes bacterium]|nr:phosphatidylserine decarboxylase family protein [Candidatus Hydrogenedentota bacterium]